MVIFMGFGCVLLHICSAFWCTLQCILVHFAVRFGAYCSAFWCILHYVLLHFAVRFAAKCVATSSY